MYQPFFMWKRDIQMAWIFTNQSHRYNFAVKIVSLQSSINKQYVEKIIENIPSDVEKITSSLCAAVQFILGLG